MNEPLIEHHFGAGVYAKETRIPATFLLKKHVHSFDHLSILAAGTIELWIDGKVTVEHAPKCFTVEAGKEHWVRAVTDVVWYCVHATDCDDPDKVDQVVIEKG